MLDISAILLKLMSKDDSLIDEIIEKATREYLMFLGKIAADIYDSCIAVYYATYTPKVYDRHGKIEGFNLYSANDIRFEDDYLIGSVDAMKLLKYKGKKDKREIVLRQVMDGIRGVGSFRNPDWPMDWTEYCTYPNEFSKYSDWSSSKNTMYEIFEEFGDTIIDATSEHFWTIVRKYV